MARIRTVKPEFFRHEGLQDLEIANPGKYPMLVFEGLFGHCDKGGVFEWKPRTLKLDILPFLPFDMAETLEILRAAGQVQRFEHEGKSYGYIPSFTEHQSIGGKEAQAPLKYPRPNSEETGKDGGSDGEVTETAGREGKGREKEGKGKERAREDSDAYNLTERIKTTYPPGTYGKQNWILAQKAIGKLLDDGEPPDDLVRLTGEYRAQCDAKGSTGTQFIRSPEKFFGEGFWRGPFHLPATKAQVAQDANIAASQEWLARSSGNA